MKIKDASGLKCFVESWRKSLETQIQSESSTWGTMTHHDPRIVGMNKQASVLQALVYAVDCADLDHSVACSNGCDEPECPLCEAYSQFERAIDCIG